MITDGPVKARLRAFWHMMRRPGHRVASFYIRDHLLALHCVDCKRAFYGRAVDPENVARDWQAFTPTKKELNNDPSCGE